MLKTTHLKFSGFTRTGLLATVLMLALPALANADDQIFIQNTAGTPMLLITDIDNMYLPQGAIADIPGNVAINFNPGFDDGDHMVIDPVGGRIFVSDHDSDFAVYDLGLNLLSPTWGVSLDEPLGLAVLPNGDILITDEADYGNPGQEGLFRLNSNLSLDATASGTSSSLFSGLEGVIYDAVHNRIYAADEDDDEIEIFDGSTLAYIGNSPASSTSDGPYWLAVDGSSNRLFALYDSRSSDSGNYGIHVFDISAGGDTLTFDQTLLGSSGGGSDCIGSIAVSESRNRLFAIDRCSDTVLVWDTLSLAPLAPVPSSRSGNNPIMVTVGHLPNAVPVPTLSQWAIMLLITGFALAGLISVQRVRSQRSA